MVQYRVHAADVPLHAVLILLLAAIVAVPLAQRLKASPVLGYLAAGLVVGPFGFAFVENTAEAERLSEFGVVFLLFTIGLDMPLPRLQAMWRYMFGLGLAQVIITGGAIGLAGVALGMQPRAALVIGGALAFSSTAAALQLLAERGELASRVGRVALAVLLFQDLAVVPLLALLPLLAPGAQSGIAAALGLALAKGVTAIVVILLLGWLVVRPLFRLSATTRIRETFAATNLLVVLGLGWATAEAGMSMALGAFLAGLLLAETEYRHQVEADILPFRGLLLGLFFITVGMAIDTPLVLRQWPEVLSLSAALLLGKPVILWVLARLFRLGAPVATRVGLLLSQCGEFAFVIFGIAQQLGILRHRDGVLLIATVALTMATTPLMAALGRRLAVAFQKPHTPDAERMTEETADLSGHVIIAGYGRIGQIVGQMLTEQRVPYVAIEQSVPLVEASRKRARPVYFGDASRAELLDAAGVDRACAAIITLDQPEAAERIVAALRRNHPDLRIIARSRDAAHARRLEQAGADDVILEALEPGLQMGAAALRVSGTPASAIDHMLDTLRHAAG
ncbi:MAG TPA: monovalent cation:proton antiporter-2 (CPA2) family protein [Stellaceae bacterium]|nr:monovalent cation:proton antiporter-2 (CPA2) family protein [Stellaceae bacterium]